MRLKGPPTFAAPRVRHVLQRACKSWKPLGLRPAAALHTRLGNRTQARRSTAQPGGIDSWEASRRRRVLFRSLRGFLSEDELRQAFALWQERFEERSGFAVLVFLEHLEREVPLEVFQIRKHLLANIFKGIDQLGPDPLKLFTEPPLIKDTTETTKTILIRSDRMVFDTLIGRLLSRLERHGTRILESFRLDLERRLGSSGLPLAAVELLTRWTQSPKHFREATLEGHLTVSEMAAIFHFFYEVACDQIGPSLADREFTASVRETERCPHAVIFSPRKLL